MKNNKRPHTGIAVTKKEKKNEYLQKMFCLKFGTLLKNLLFYHRNSIAAITKFQNCLTDSLF
jgi:hypothetical protein